MLKTGDKLICTLGNGCYKEGETYTVGRFINDKFFKLMTGYDGEYWYATNDASGIKVQFDDIKDEYSEAWFITENETSDTCAA